jgi:hypothetical protein
LHQIDWLQLQPWLSDKLAHDWEEESLVWADEITVMFDALLERCLPDMLNCITRISIKGLNATFWDAYQTNQVNKRKRARE